MGRKGDLAVIGRLCLAVAALYFAFKYLFILFLPFLIGFAFSRLIRPMVRWFYRKFRVPKGISACIMLVVLMGTLLWLGFMLIRECTSQITFFLSQWSYYKPIISGEIQNVCCRVEDAFSIQRDSIYPVLCDNFAQFVDGTKSSMMSGIMSYSVPTVMKLIQISIFFMAMVVSAFFYSTTDDGNLEELLERLPYKEKCIAIITKLKIAIVAFIKTQAIIMFTTMVICIVGLLILKNPYGIILGIVIGLLDAMPLIGAGLIFIPWAIAMLVMRRITYSVGLIVIFLLCYLAREVLEPKLMGKDVGLSPIISLISIYIGYYLFGIPGVVFGPVGYVVLKEIWD